MPIRKGKLLSKKRIMRSILCKRLTCKVKQENDLIWLATVNEVSAAFAYGLTKAEAVKNAKRFARTLLKHQQLRKRVLSRRSNARKTL